MNYLREISEYFIEKRCGALQVSHMDLMTIMKWQNDGVPVKIAKKAIDETFESLKGVDGRPVKRITRISYCNKRLKKLIRDYRTKISRPPQQEADANEEKSIKELLGETVKKRLPNYEKEILESFRKGPLGQKRKACQVEETVRSGFLEIVQKEERTGYDSLDDFQNDLRRLDGKVDQILVKILDQEELNNIRRKTETGLAPFAAKMSKKQYDKTFQVQFSAKLREVCRLRRLSLYDIL